jgi:hypothetical protein
MIYVFLTNSTVTDVARVDPATIFAPAYAAQFIEAPDEVTHGWTFDGIAWTAPPAAPPPGPPAAVTMRQARLALLGAGKLDDVAAAIAGLPSPQKEAAQIEWEYSTEVKRDSTLVTQLAPALSLDTAALDALFTQAATL